MKKKNNRIKSCRVSLFTRLVLTASMKLKMKKVKEKEQEEAERNVNNAGDVSANLETHTIIFL